MDLSNYFAFYEIEPGFELDTQLLRKKYVQINREFHPDFFTLQPDKQEEALSITSYNNDAYKTLNSFESRVAYYLTLNGLYNAEIKADLPPDFLLEVMELNEELEELQESKLDLSKFYEKVTGMKDLCLDSLHKIGEELAISSDKKSLLKQAKSEFQKLKYFSSLLEK